MLLQVRPGEPVYAQVNRDKKRSRGGPDMAGYDYSDHAQHWVIQDNAGNILDTSQVSGQTSSANNSHNTQGGDSWV